MRKAGTVQVCQVLSATTAEQTSTASDACVAQWVSTKLLEKLFHLLLLSGSTSSLTALPKKKAAESTILPQSVSTITEALLIFQGTGYVSECMQERCIHARLHWNTEGGTTVAGQLVNTLIWDVKQIIFFSSLSPDYDLET